MLIFLTPDAHTAGGEDSLSSPNSYGFSVKKVVIDPGHGGKDPGCLGSTTREKDIALKIALHLGAEINAAYPDVEVIFTRDSDVFIPLHERARIANRANADLFISIHCNYIGTRNKARGTETYIMGLHRAKENLEVAKRENSAILMEDDYAEHYDGYDPDSPEGHILMSMYQNAHLEQSIALAHAIETQFENSLKRHSRGVKQAGFLVLRKTTMPSVLIETGFLSTDEDEKFLSSEIGQKQVARGIFQAFANYKKTIERSSALNVTKASVKAVADTASVSTDQSYFVQLIASKKPIHVEATALSMIGNLKTTVDDDYYKYLAGPYETARDASLAKTRLEDMGFRGAFVVVFEGEVRVGINPNSGVSGN